MINKIFQVISRLVLVLILLGIGSQSVFGSALAQSNSEEQASTQPAGPIDPEELEAFLDDLLAAEMAERHIPGAMVAVVEDGSVLLAKGYGYADLDEQLPVDPERTLFRIGSVSKLITWTAVMQLLEQGKLSLDTNVNEYLDFEIPDTFEKPINLGHLMSHTAGFEDKGLDMWKLQADEMSPLDVYLKDNLPVRVFPAGQVIAYSNYGASLAGYIVERVSGQPFDEYVEQNIFEPLGMTQSSFRQPLPESLAGNMARGYNYTKEEYVGGSFEYLLTSPGGSMSATANDMARFMIAHLQNGELDGRRILQEETAIQMHSQLYTPDPRLDGLAHGFFANTVNGQRLLIHGGATNVFRSGLYLIPGQNLGLFISTNSSSGWGTGDAVIKAFIDRYYPVAETPNPHSAPGFAERIDPYLGEYTRARSNFSSFEKFNRLTMPIHIKLDSDGNLAISAPGLLLHFAEVEPGLLQDIDEPANQVVYRTGLDGRMFLSTAINNDTSDLFKTSWYGGSTLHLGLFLTGTLLFLGAIVAWPISFFIGRRKRSDAAQATPLSARLAHWAAALFGLLLLLSMLGFTSFFMDILPGFGVPKLYFETPPVLNFLLALSYVLAGLALAILVFAVLAWLRRYWSLGGRIFYSLLAVMALLLTWVLLYWNLLG